MFARFAPIVAVAAIAAAAIATPAAAVSAVNFNFAGPAGTTNVASVSRTSNGITATATALNFTVAPGAIASLADFTAGTRLIQQNAPGIGVTGGASTFQIDTNQPGAREAVLITGSRSFALGGLVLGNVDRNDTLGLFGVRSDNSLVSLGFGPSRIATGFDGAVGFSNNIPITDSAVGTTTLTFGSVNDYFDRYILTSAVGGDVLFGGDLGQGFSINAVSGIVPEPGTWAMLVLGFGLVGAAARRNRFGRRPLSVLA